MALFKVNTQPTEQQLRQFGVICMFVFPLVAWLWKADQSTIVIAAIAGGAMAVVGLMIPRWLKPLFVALILVTMPLGIVVGELILVVIFFCVFLPMAVAFKIVGRDVLQRRLVPDAATFWQARTTPSDSRKYFRQF